MIYCEALRQFQRNSPIQEWAHPHKMAISKKSKTTLPPTIKSIIGLKTLDKVRNTFKK